MKKYIPFLLLFIHYSAFAQVGINTTGTAPAPAAMLDVSSTNKGVLIPRMTSIQKLAIQNPTEGLMVYDTDVKQFSYCLAVFAGTAVNCQWVNFGNTQVPLSSWNVNGNDISNANSGNVGIGNTNPQSVLDVQGDIRFRSSNITLAPGFSGELDATTTKASVYNLNSNVTITGINGGVDGRILTIVNTTATTQIRIKLIDESDILSTSNSSNKMSLGNTFLILYGGSIVFRYDGFRQRWAVVSKIGVNDGTVATWQLSGNAGNELKNTNAGGFWSANAIGLDGNSNGGTNPPTAPINGGGTRLMWIPSRSAFRVGTVLNDVWDASNIGLFSFAAGFSPKASGYASTALGFGSTASGDLSTAMGSITTASGYSSTAMGENSTASGISSHAMGSGTTASGNSSHAMGSVTTASGDFSTAMGRSTLAFGVNSTAMGYSTTASGNRSTAMGNYGSTNGYIGSFMIHDNINENIAGITSNSADNQMVMKFDGGFGFYSGGAADASMGFEKTRGLTVYGKGISTYGGGNIYTENGGKIGVNTATPNATLQVNGGVSMPIKVVTGNYTVQDGDYTLEVNLPNGVVAIITLPNTNLAPGRIINVVILNPYSIVDINANGNFFEELGNASSGSGNIKMGVNLQCGVLQYRSTPYDQIINGWIKISSWSWQ